MKIQISIRKLLSFFFVVIATATSPLCSFGILQADNATDQTNELAQELTDDQQIVAIPVSISTKFKVGEEVKLVLVNPEGRDEVIVEGVKVIRIGEVNMIEKEGEEKTFVRYVSIVTSNEQGDKINEAIKSRNGQFVLQPMNAETAQPGNRSSDSELNGNPMPTNAVLPPRLSGDLNNDLLNPNRQTNQANQTPRSPLQQPDSKVVLNAQQLREVARMFELQAATLEDNGNYEKADLIREAVKKIREAARIE